LVACSARTPAVVVNAVVVAMTLIVGG
jgi:hypothetical protein